MVIQSWVTGRRAVSLPFSDYCQPLLNDDREFYSLFENIINVGKDESWKFIEFKNAGKFIDEENNYLIEYHHKLNLYSDVGQLFSSLSSNTRRNIKKAEKEKVKIIKSTSFEAVEAFYKLNCITRKKHGIPPQPKAFFRNLHKYILSNDLGFIMNAIHQNKVIASAVYLLFGNKAIYKYGASNFNYQDLRANNLIMWSAISWCAENGYEEFSFGKTEAENDGLRRFKNGWNTEEKILKTFRYSPVEKKFITIKSKSSGFHSKVFSKLPVPLSILIGRFVYRHIG